MLFLSNSDSSLLFFSFFFRLHLYQFGMVVAIVHWVFDLEMFVTLGKLVKYASPSQNISEAKIRLGFTKACLLFWTVMLVKYLKKLIHC